MGAAEQAAQAQPRSSPEPPNHPCSPLQGLSLPALCKATEAWPWGDSSGLSPVYKWQMGSLTAALLLAAEVGTIFSIKPCFVPLLGPQDPVPVQRTGWEQPGCCSAGHAPRVPATG